MKDPYEQTWLKRLLEREGRRRSDQTLGFLRALKELLVILAIIWLSLTGGDPSALIGLVGG